MAISLFKSAISGRVFRPSEFNGNMLAIETAFNNLETAAGALAALTTTEKGSLVGAINELKTAISAANLLTAIKTVDGSGSGLDADTLDGKNLSASGVGDTVALRDGLGQITTAYNLKYAAQAGAGTDLDAWNNGGAGGLLAFNISGANAPVGATFGFVECLYFIGTGFAPRAQGAQQVLLQRYTNFDGSGVWLRAYHNDDGTDYWDSWTKIGPA